MLSIFRTFLVSKLDKSIEIKEIHSLNMLLIEVTNDVSKFVTSNDVKEVHE